jgi:hypothetical protein
MSFAEKAYLAMVILGMLAFIAVLAWGWWVTQERKASERRAAQAPITVKTEAAVRPS